jgi:glycosyltransferase involved in cell wall biosynthesis
VNTDPQQPFVVAHVTTVDSSLWYLLRPQLRAMRDLGAHVVGISAPGPYVAALEAEGIQHIELSSSSRSPNVRADLRAALELWRVLRTTHVDVLHTHNPKPGLYGRVVARLAGVPVVVNTNHGLYIRDGRRVQRWLILALEAVASRFCDAELVQNSEDLALLTRWGLYPRKRARLLGNGVDLARFHPPRDAAERRKARTELGIGEGEIAVGVVARLVAEKGLPELFEAARMLSRRHAVIVIGPTDLDKPDALSEAELAEARAAGVRLLGLRDDVDLLYRGLDLFVLPSHREGYPRAAMEAAASGVPVIATDIRGCRQVVSDGLTGLLVPVRSPAHLANAIRILSDDTSLRDDMGRAAVERARQCFDERRVVETVVASYAWAVLNRRRWPSKPIRRPPWHSEHG